MKKDKDLMIHKTLLYIYEPQLATTWPLQQGA